MYNNLPGKPPITPDFDPNTRITHPSNKVTIPEHTFVIDSRQRNTQLYPTPSEYEVHLAEPRHNITSLELKGSVIPRSSSNIHSTNKYINFNIGSTVTGTSLTRPGLGYTNVPTVTIDPPRNSGVQATAHATISNGVVTSIIIDNAGSGYIASMPPNIYINGLAQVPASAIAIVGTSYTATLREGQYTIGGNPNPPTTSVPTNLIAEIQAEMNYVVNGGAYDPTSSSPFVVRLVSLYPEIGATSGSPEANATNANMFNRILITNVNSDPWELLFSSGSRSKISAVNVMGFDRRDYTSTSTSAVTIAGPLTLIPAGTSIRADNDYNLLDDPSYVIVNFIVRDRTMNRIDSINLSLNQSFGTMVFDASPSNVLTDTTGTIALDGDSIPLLVGPITKGTFWTAPGLLKALRGFDFDQKILYFDVPITIDKIRIKFSKFSTFQDGHPEIYDFAARDHLLIFGIKQGDLATGLAK